jgi:VWFA-related protein
VEGLRREDFTLREDGQERKIAMFSVDDTRRTSGADVPPAPPMTFTNGLASGAPMVTAFLFDQLNTRLADQQLAKKDFLRYLRNLPANERVAVFALGYELQLLQDFTQDVSQLQAAMTKHSDRASTEADASSTAPASSNSLTGDRSTTAQWDSFLASSAEPYRNFQETVRATRTAAALETIAAHLRGIPGRKTLIWISGGFPIQLGLHGAGQSPPQSDANARDSSHPVREGRSGAGSAAASHSGGGGGNGAADSASASDTMPGIPGTDLSFESDVARAIRALNESAVAVYPVDARGLMTPTPFQADRAAYGKRNKPPRATASPDYNYETLETLALDTGGRAFHNINDLSHAIQMADEDARVSYSLAFYPSAASLDDTYHRLEVTVTRPGVALRYRPGYLAATQAAATAALADAIANPVPLAGIAFTAHLEPVEGGYRMSATLDPHNITLERKDGKWTGALQFLVVVGKVEQLTMVPLSFSDAVFQQIQDKGLVLGGRVKAPPGTTGFSVGFRDVSSGLVGTLHVPLNAAGR